MSEENFWRCTPRKLFALLEAHNKANSLDENKPKQKVEKLSLEEALAWAGKR